MRCVTILFMLCICSLILPTSWLASIVSLTPILTPITSPSHHFLSQVKGLSLIISQEAVIWHIHPHLRKFPCPHQQGTLGLSSAHKPQPPQLQTQHISHTFLLSCLSQCKGRIVLFQQLRLCYYLCERLSYHNFCIIGGNPSSSRLSTHIWVACTLPGMFSHHWTLLKPSKNCNKS